METNAKTTMYIVQHQPKPNLKSLI